VAPALPAEIVTGMAQQQLAEVLEHRVVLQVMLAHTTAVTADIQPAAEAAEQDLETLLLPCKQAVVEAVVPEAAEHLLLKRIKAETVALELRLLGLITLPCLSVVAGAAEQLTMAVLVHLDQALEILEITLAEVAKLVLVVVAAAAEHTLQLQALLARCPVLLADLAVLD